MKFWPVIRHIRFLLSPRWKHMNLALDRVRISIDRAIAEPKNADALVMVAQSWLADASYEWGHLEAIRDGKE
jgi:hypothetical protein